MKSEIRLDRATAGKLKRLDNGFIRAPITATRVGILVYRSDDGSEWREFRPEDEVFRADSMESLAGVPVTNDHPKELLHAENTKAHAVGFTSDQVSRKDIFLSTSITITDKTTVDALDQGKHEVSCGYVCDVDHKPGVWKGERYDAIQRNIRYNHVALVAKGRAGPEVRVHLDDQTHTEKVMRLDSLIENSNINDGDPMDKIIVIDGVEYKVSSETHAAITAKFKKDSDSITELKSKFDTETAEKTKSIARADSLKDEVEKLKSTTPKLDEKDIQERVAKRVSLERFASDRLDSDLTKMADRDIIVALIHLDNKEFKAEGKDDVYLQARFDHMTETAVKKDKKPGGSYEGGRRISEDRERNDGSNKQKTASEVRQENMIKAQNAWQKPIGYSLAKN